MKKTLWIVIEKGLAFMLRRVIWKLFYILFEYKKARMAKNVQVPSIIHFLDINFELHPSMRGLSKELFLFGSHEPLATSIYIDNLSSGNHVIDIGSNIGYYLLLASNRVGNKGRLLGFEPVPDVYNILESNVNKFKLNNIEIFPWAIGEKSGSIPFYKSEVPNWGSILQNNKLYQTHSISVQSKTLDDILLEFPDFHPNALRMDLEGAELTILESAQKVLQKYKPLLFIEFHNKTLGWEAVKKSITNLHNIGYSYGIVIERTWDNPWTPNWMRKRRCWRGSIENLIKIVESPNNHIVNSTLNFILKTDI